MKTSAAILLAAASSLPLFAKATTVRGSPTAASYTTQVLSLDTVDTGRLVELVVAARADGTSLLL
eukprot:contig_43461_g9739